MGGKQGESDRVAGHLALPVQWGRQTSSRRGDVGALCVSSDLTVHTHNPFVQQVCVWSLECVLPCAGCCWGEREHIKIMSPQAFPSQGEKGRGSPGVTRQLHPCPIAPSTPCQLCRVRFGALYAPHPDVSGPIW